MSTLEHLLKRFNLDSIAKKPPIQVTITRDDLPVIYNELGFKVGAEIGVKEGEYSEIICKNIPGVKLFCIDPWIPYRGYRDFTSKERLDGFYETTKKRLEPYNCTLIKNQSMDALKDVEDKSLDFVYIDGNHDFQHVTNDICEWLKKLKIGGILAGHDYRRDVKQCFTHSVDVVNGYTYSYKINPWFLTNDYPRSYFWVHNG